MAPKKKMKFSQSGSNQPNSPDRRSSTPMQRLQPGGATAPQTDAPDQVGGQEKGDGGSTMTLRRSTVSQQRSTVGRVNDNPVFFDKERELYIKQLHNCNSGSSQRVHHQIRSSNVELQASLRKENFRKTQNPFSEIRRVKKLLKLGESVCKVVIQDVICGSGFVLFDTFILTNAHLFKDCVEGETLKEGVNVFAVFNYEVKSQANHYKFQLAHQSNIWSLRDLDYAIFQINPHESEGKTAKVPPGLLKNFGEKPSNGEGCIIGHPEGNVKKIDPISIIEKENRDQSLGDLNDELRRIYTINNNQTIKNYPHKDAIMTYYSFMYGGSSGSPVFDACGRVFGLHSGGLFFGSKKPDESVMEFAIPLLRIFENFVTKLKEQGNRVLLAIIKKEIKRNSRLKKVFRVVTGTEEFMDTD